MLPDIIGDSVANADTKHGLAEGANFKSIGIDIDTTGRRLSDKIFQLAAFTPTEHFEQYIMPSVNLNSAARQRHQVRIIKVKGHRVLKSIQSNKIIRTQSEAAGFRNLISWLEEQSSNCDGIVLICHEERKFIPLMIVQSLIQLNMLTAFAKLVKGFVNTNNLAMATMGGADRMYFNVRNLSKLLNKGRVDNAPEEFVGSANARAKLAFNVAVELCDREPRSSKDSGSLCQALGPYIDTIDIEIRDLDLENVNLKRQNSFRPLFLNYFKTTVHRVRAVKFRILLAENGLDLGILNEIWKEIRMQGLISTLAPIENLTSKEKTELVILLDSYFDPNKVAIKPVAKAARRRRRHNNSPASTTGEKETLDQNLSFQPDSTPKTSTPNKERVPNGKRTRSANGNENRNGDGNNHRGKVRRKRNARRMKPAAHKSGQDGAATEQPLQENKRN
ncbi:maternal protein exuperantia-like [Drosophila montana]|uniref:maternal protein exuperantia-like n=1 Tax=Drosophila montana TaxID=40370 RepID=UPI00313C6F20